MTKDEAEELLREGEVGRREMAKIWARMEDVDRDRRDLDLTLRVVEGVLANASILDEHAPRVPLKLSYQGSLGQAQLFLRKAAEALEEAKGFLPDE